MENFKLNEVVLSEQNGFGVVVFKNYDTSVRVEFSSGLRPLYWQDGSEYNPHNERDYIKKFVSSYKPQ